ncbi:MAG: hypothetical protein JW909_04225 [Planctomycetes bacterium]|nr:hypothetical protein [Planctomycetota bacterium]
MQMENVRVAAVQFAPVVADKDANLAKVRDLACRAAEQGAEAVCFHEQSLNGYNLWSQPAGGEKGTEKGGIWAPAWSELGLDPYSVAEAVPGGPSVRALEKIAKEKKIVVMAGIHEVDEDNAVYNCYFAVGPQGFIGKYRKCHCVPGAEYAYFKQGNAFPVFNAGKFNFGVLICYDNHFPEAHRIYGIKGAHVIVMPHVTVGRAWWPEETHSLDEAHEQARQWVLKWLRARAFDNSVYCIFANQVDPGGKGCLGASMIVDPEGRVAARAGKVDEEIVTADLDASFYYQVRKRSHDYLNHRRPELYGELVRGPRVQRHKR